MNSQSMLTGLLFVSVTASQIEWKISPENKAVVNNTDVRLDCLAEDEGGRTLVYTWKYNGSTIQTKTSVFFNNTLLIPKFSTSDVGEYECVVGVESSYVANQSLSETRKALVILAYINKFIVNPVTIRAAKNTSVTIECITGKSAPKPEVFWNLNGQRLEDGVQLIAGYGDSDSTGLSGQISMKLVINMEKKYTGILRCNAVNSVLQEHVSSSDASISLARSTGPPVIVVPPPREVITPLNTSLVLECLIDGYKVTTRWYKNDEVFTGSTTSFVHQGSLMFVRMLLEDSGIYYCEGNNSLGNVTSALVNVTVTVINEEFRIEPSDVTIFAGQPLSLNCIPPISVPPATVTWYKDNVPLTLDSSDPSLTLVAPEEGVWDLHFNSVQAIHEGRYFCVAENLLAVPSSRTSRVAKLTVQGAPIFVEPPLSQRVIKGRLLQLRCLVEGSPSPTVTWSYDGLVLQPSNQIGLRDGNQELWITNVDKSHEGTYTCHAKNIFGSKTVKAFIKIIVPPVTLKDFGNIVATTGDTAILPCDIYGDPKPDVKWFKESHEIQESTSRYVINLSLHIDNVTAADAGVYSCQGHNEAGSSWANGSLSVLVPPKITEGPVDTVVVYGGSVLFPCKTEAVPQSSVQWLYNSTQYLPEGVSFLPDRITLRISPVEWQHVGTYTCVASNSVGLDRQAGVLRLKVIPAISEFKGRTVVDKGETIEIECAHKGIPAPSVEWIHKGEIINETLDGRVTFPTRKVLKFKFATKSDAGEYTCKISNDVGSDSQSVRLYVIEPPNPPILTGAIPLSMSSVELTWIPNSQEPQTNVTGYAVNYKMRPDPAFLTYPGRLPATLQHYEVEGLQPGTQYTFTVSADNSAGLGLPSNALTVITLEAGPSEPVHLRVLSTFPRRVHLSWQIPQHSRGNIRKYQIQYREAEETNSIITEYEVRDILNPDLPNQVYDLNDLHPYTEYEIRVRAGNIQQERDLWGDYSVTINVRTLPAAPSTGPRNVTAVAVSPYIISVEWEPPPVWEENGPITGYTVRYRDLLYQSAFEKLHTLSSVTKVNITELSPWRNYSLMVEAKNIVGRSPSSDSVTIQTLPTVLTTSPKNVRISVTSATSLTVSWQIPPVSEWTNKISGSCVQYQVTGELNWTNITTNGTATSQVNISNLTPWTQYNVRVSFFTNTKATDIGPFTKTLSEKTLPDVPGPVLNLDGVSTDVSISVSWSPPLKKTGLLKYYRVAYFPTGNTGWSSGNEGEVLPGMSDDQFGPTKSVLTHTENTTITNLVPNTLYNISVSMATEAGEGPIASFMKSTKSYRVQETTLGHEELFENITDVTTDPTFNTTSNLLTNPGGSSKRNLAVIVAGSLTGGIFVLVIIAIIIWRCLKKRKAGRDHYMKSVVSGVRITKRDSVTYDRQILDPTNIGEDETATQHNTSDDAQHRYGSITTHEPVPQSPNSVTSTDEVSPTPNPIKKSNSFFRSLRNSFSGDSVFAISSGPGIENPSYFEENMSATLPRSGIPSMTADEVYSQTEKTQRKNRMRSESAAAIAIMRSSGNLAITTNDTDNLINNEAFVVYNERTAL